MRFRMLRRDIPGVVLLVLLIIVPLLTHPRDSSVPLSIESLKLASKNSWNCTKPNMNREEMALNLVQYDPSSDPKDDLNDETPRTAEEVKRARELLAEVGFVYPNGDESVITWMDFDGDGNCDFTVTVGVGGMRPIERMMLFRGLGNRQFKLVDAHLAYMETNITLIPYIPVRVAGERLPLVVVPRDGRLLRWRADHSGFDTCDAAGSSMATSPDFATLCEALPRIIRWAENGLPHKNVMVRWKR